MEIVKYILVSSGSSQWMS